MSSKQDTIRISSHIGQSALTIWVINYRPYRVEDKLQLIYVLLMLAMHPLIVFATLKMRIRR